MPNIPTEKKIELLCREYDRPFTLEDLRGKFVERYTYVPTYQQLAFNVPRLPFIQRIKDNNGAVYQVRA